MEVRVIMFKPKLKLSALLFAAFLVGLTLSSFTKAINPMEALGLAVVLLGTSLFIGAMLFLAGFGAWILYLCCVDGLEGAAHALRHSGFVKESLVKEPAK